jgi:hypothetical protein
LIILRLVFDNSLKKIPKVLKIERRHEIIDGIEEQQHGRMIEGLSVKDLRGQYPGMTSGGRQ